MSLSYSASYVQVGGVSLSKQQFALLEEFNLGPFRITLCSSSLPCIFTSYFLSDQLFVHWHGALAVAHCALSHCVMSNSFVFQLHLRSRGATMLNDYNDGWLDACGRRKKVPILVSVTKHLIWCLVLCCIVLCDIMLFNTVSNFLHGKFTFRNFNQ